MTVKELTTKIWQKREECSENEFTYWQNISFAVETIENCCNEFLGKKNMPIVAGYGKLLIMELWTIRELLICLNKSTSELDQLFPNLKEFRDAYAHLKERVEGFEKPFGKPKVALNRAHKVIANGAMTSIDGQNWKVSGGFTRLFNFHMGEGVRVVFGIINNFLICNSSNDLLELEITDDLTLKVVDIVNNASC